MDLSKNRKIITTKDGSHSLLVPDLNEQYHSVHGAIQEAKHVFLKMGVDACEKSNINVLEVGFGTGLNALLTCLYAHDKGLNVEYTTLEKYPVTQEEYTALNYGELVNNNALFNHLHSCVWDQFVQIDENFSIKKMHCDLTCDDIPAGYDVVFFDAFAPNKQPHLWSEFIFQKIYKSLNCGGLLVTYCAQGAARRAMISAGFSVEKVAGPPGKREMLRAWKS